ncbi:MAG TPA: hypothetical protein VI541_03725, partial [Actinomycetota bacterium]|nr:hypothetical protein [Actinomycetota bacterium]
AYRGLGAWVDVFDYSLGNHMDVAAAVSEMSSRGVRTLYLETSRWKEPQAFVDAATADLFIERAHAVGIKVVGWYLPGFGDIDRDIQRSLAVLQHSTPSGHRFDGLAPDIENRQEVSQDRLAFNAGIIEYSKRLRAAVPAGTVLGAIVVDAKNNERAPERWAGFPWPEIAKYYDIVMPMAYWSVTKKDCSVQYDAGAYINDVVAKTEALMGTSKPMHIIGGIANCTTTQEVEQYVAALRAVGSLGGGLYDFQTTQARPEKDQFWASLAGLNS